MSTQDLQPLDDPALIRGRPSTSIYLVFATIIGGITAIGVIGALLLALRGVQTTTLVLVPVITAVLVLGLLGVAVSIIGMRASRQVRRLLDQVSTLEHRTSILAEQSLARAQSEASPPAPTIDPMELRLLFTDIRDILLMPQELRLKRFQTLAEAEFVRRLEAADRYIQSRDFHRARNELTSLANRFGADERVREARNCLEQAAEETRAQDIAQALTRSQDLMSLARWEEAEQLARELADKYPAAPEPAALHERVVRERRLFEQRNRQRMLDEIQQQVRQRRWREAADGTRQFLQMFPGDVEATPLTEQLKTLDANAEIQTRQLLEQQYKELLGQHRYWDAVGLARRIIGEYPISPQANALRGQVARLEELARRHEPQA